MNQVRNARTHEKRHFRADSERGRSREAKCRSEQMHPIQQVSRQVYFSNVDVTLPSRTNTRVGANPYGAECNREGPTATTTRKTNRQSHQKCVSAHNPPQRTTMMAQPTEGTRIHPQLSRLPELLPTDQSLSYSTSRIRPPKRLLSTSQDCVGCCGSDEWP